MTCKHRGDRITAMTRPTPLLGTWSDPALAHFADIKQCDICEDCGAWLSIGPANDTDAVKIEIRAAELAHDGALASGEWNGYESLGWCSPDGRHLDLAASESWTERDQTVYVTGMLAAEIAAL